MPFEQQIESIRNESFMYLGHNHWLQPDIVGEEVWGYLIYHPHAVTGEMCCGYINIKKGATTPDGRLRPIWTVLSEDPLTLVPSIHDTKEDGDHGWIQQGHWVKA